MGDNAWAGYGPTADEYNLQRVIDSLNLQIDVLRSELSAANEKRAALEAALLRACRHASYCGTECPRTGGECSRPEELDENGRCGACGFDCDVDFIAECWRLKFMKPEDGGETNG